MNALQQASSDRVHHQRVVVMGAGKMGLPMALHLQHAGHTVTVCDPDPQRQKLAQDSGLRAQANAAQALSLAQVVVSSLPHDAALLQVSALVAQAAPRGALFVDTSTVSVSASAQAALPLHAADVAYLRATVSGNNKMAEAAQLTVMASGPRNAYDQALPLLQTWGATQFYLGAAEEARLMKLVVNLLIAQTSAMLAEALTLGQKGGLQWADMWQVIGASAVASPIVRAKAAQLSQHDYRPTFTVQQMMKDVGLILQAGADVQTPLPQTALTAQNLLAACAQGDAALDYAAVIRVAQRQADLGAT